MPPEPSDGVRARGFKRTRANSQSEGPNPGRCARAPRAAFPACGAPWRWRRRSSRTAPSTATIGASTSMVIPGTSISRSRISCAGPDLRYRATGALGAPGARETQDPQAGDDAEQRTYELRAAVVIISLTAVPVIAAVHRGPAVMAPPPARPFRRRAPHHRVGHQADASALRFALGRPFRCRPLLSFITLSELNRLHFPTRR